jgi:hypothetical protein
LILSLGLAVCATAALILAVLYFRKPDGEAPLEQHDTESPQGKFTGTVIYAIPYRLPPNLKLTSAKRPFDIAKQDEKGFTWTARTMVDDIKNDKGFGAEMLARRYDLGYLLSEGYVGPTAPPIEDFTWQAKGVRATEDPKPKPQ